MVLVVANGELRFIRNDHILQSEWHWVAALGVVDGSKSLGLPLNIRWLQVSIVIDCERSVEKVCFAKAAYILEV